MRNQNPDPDAEPGHEHLFKIFWFFLTEQEFNYLNKIFHNFFLKDFCFSLGLIFCSLDPGSVDPHNCVDPNLGSQNVADPDPKHWSGLKQTDTFTSYNALYVRLNATLM